MSQCDEVQDLVARCVDALDRGEADPVSRVCAEHAELRDQVQDRLDRLRGLGLLGSRDGDRDDDRNGGLESFGQYEVQHKLGSGGMGSVYLCEQTGLVRRHVALKLVKRGMDTDEILARFRLEHETLARMQHPHIAQIFDAGATPDGRSFFAMEYVEGQPITAWCDSRQLDVRARAELFLDVLAAVEHAHLKGVIHRDLKPSNILVTEVDGEPLVKVIDFGLAKLLGAADFERTAYTLDGHVVGTPEYMSPEQATDSAAAVDARSDVYSLGAVFYELITGALPIDSRHLRGGAWATVQRILRESEPPTPSSRVSLDPGSGLRAETRGADTLALRRCLRGELDWITLCALAKEPQRRYPSVRDFADDLRRHLAGGQVEAAPPSRSYRLRKAVRRHRVAVAVGTAIAITTVVGATGIVLAMLRAERNAAEATTMYGAAVDAVDELLFRNAESRLRGRPNASELMFELYRDARRFYQRLAALRADDHELRYRLAITDLALGSEAMGLRGAAAEVEPLLRGSLDELAAMAEQWPDDPRFGWKSGVARMRLAHMFAVRGQLDVAAGEIDAALALLSDHGTDGDRLHDLVEAHGLAYDIDRGQAASEQGVASVAHLDRAMALAGELVSQRGSAGDLLQQANLIESRAIAAAEARDVIGGQELLTKALLVLDAVPPAERELEGYRANRVEVLVLSGKFAAQLKQLGRAVERFEAARVGYDALLAGNPDNMRFLEAAVENVALLGGYLHRLERYEEAGAPLRRGLALARRGRAADPAHARLGHLGGVLIEFLLDLIERGVIEDDGEKAALIAERKRFGG